MSIIKEMTDDELIKALRIARKEVSVFDAIPSWYIEQTEEVGEELRRRGYDTIKI